ncbi:MoxR-like ATPase [Bhargavaea ginsengi]|uniref:MoxR-like ATPase n=1 Tax=Bhargavaea ginsengi TaxID=426757 RepID=A0A1H6YWY3_9BACL|nr:AAA family ATPase [Bhargavaea ginsengi]SEJ45708.1 MoxR-like ATPase [Bhargavaea ginsengi]
MENNLAKIDEIKDALNARFQEREAEIEAILVAALARQHILMIGPAGTAKSALVMELSKMIQGTQYFQWLLTRFSTPEELFGPLSLKDLEQGVYKRNTKNKMPEAHVAFLDEIFKANSAILNSLLTLLNERVFYNDGAPVQVPLMSVIGASNEFPEDGEGLEALFDRFLLRFEVDYIADEANFIAMMKDSGQHQQRPVMTLEELIDLQHMTDQVAIQDEVYTALLKIRNELRDEGIRPSDRRFKQSLSLLQARALINKRQTVLPEDLILLEHSLWETTDQKEIVCIIVRRHAQDALVKTLDSMRREAKDIFGRVRKDPSAEYGMEASQKLKKLEANLEQLKVRHEGRSEEIDTVLLKVKSMQQELAVNSMYEGDNGQDTSGIYYRM